MSETGRGSSSDCIIYVTLPESLRVNDKLVKSEISLAFWDVLGNPVNVIFLLSFNKVEF